MGVTVEGGKDGERDNVERQEEVKEINKGKRQALLRLTKKAWCRRRKRQKGRE